MNEDFRLNRHTKLWEDQNLRIKRTVAASLILGILLLMNVLRPYAQDLDKRREIRAEVEMYEKEKTQIEVSISAMDDFKQTLGKVQHVISSQPWMREKNKLVETLAEINNRGEGGWKRYQEEADNTVRAIGGQVEAMVVKPLDNFFLNDPQVSQLMPELYAELKKLPQAIDEWVNTNIGKRWYRTLHSKTRQVEFLSKTLDDELRVFHRKIRQEKPKLASKINELNQKIVSLENDSDIQAKEKLLTVLEARMEKILPEWVRGMISVDQMIQFYPVLVVGIVIYVMVLGFFLNYHYQSMAELRNITEFEKKDPVFSSLWTLTFRGIRGTLTTIAAYAGFVLIMWILFEAGSDIFAKWIVEENKGFLDKGHLTVIQLGGRCVLGASLCLIVFKPFYQKKEA